MLKILHKGQQISLDLDQTNWTGDIETDKDLVAAFKGGRLVAIGSAGIVLADGVAANTKRPIGFLINDAAGAFYENIPALASGKAAVALAQNCVVVTDQIDTALTFAKGDLLYAGTSTKVGLVTNVPGAGAIVIGIANSAASSAAPELEIIVGA